MTAGILQYGRTYSLTAGPEAGGVGRRWSDVRLAFSIEKTRKKRPNKAKVQMWNLSENSRAFLQQEGLRLELAAGYEETPPVIISGTLDDAAVKYDGVDVVLELDVRDGGSSFSTSIINESWLEGVTRRQLLQRVAQRMGLRYATLPGDLAEVIYRQGYTATAPGRDVLDELLQGEATWSIQDGELVVDTGSGTQEEALLISPDTGLEGSPEAKRKRGQVVGVQFAIKLNGRVRPSRKLVLRSKQYSDAVVVVQKVEHRGDTHGDAWTTQVEGKLQ